MKQYLLHSLGIESECGLFIPVLKKNTAIPCQKTRLMFSPETDNQKTVILKILAGSSWDSSNNETLGEITLSDLPPSYRGVPFISISFFVDGDGVLQVVVENLKDGRIIIHTEKIQTSNVKGSEKPTSLELSDEIYLEKTRIYSLARRMIRSSLKTLENSDNMSYPEKVEFEKNIADLECAVNLKADIESVNNLMEELSSSAMNFHYTVFTKS